MVLIEAIFDNPRRCDTTRPHHLAGAPWRVFLEQDGKSLTVSLSDHAMQEIVSDMLAACAAIPEGELLPLVRQAAEAFRKRP